MYTYNIHIHLPKQMTVYVYIYIQSTVQMMHVQAHAASEFHTKMPYFAHGFAHP